MTMRRTGWMVLMASVFFGSAGAGADEHVQTTLEQAPEGYRVGVSAASLAGLKEKVRPTLTYDYEDFHLMFWARIDEAGKPRFAVATAHLLGATKRSAARWVSFEPPAGAGYQEIVNGLSMEVLPRIAVPVVEKQPEANVVALWARNLGHKQEVGTVYEVAYHIEPCGAIHCCSSEHRLIVLHTPENAWKLLQFIDGAESSDVGETNVMVRARWTASAASPLALTVTSGTVFRQSEKGISAYSDEIFTGPLDHMTSRVVNYLCVGKGDSFTSLTARFAEQEFPADAKGIYRQLPEFRAAIARLTPGLDVDHLRVGDRLILPELGRFKGE